MAPSVRAEWWRPPAAAGMGLTETVAAPVKDGSVPFIALLILTFVQLFAPQAFVPTLARMHIVLLAGAFAVGAHCWTQFATRRPLLRPTREMWLAGALLGWAIATLPLSISPSESVGMLLDLYLKTLIFFWLLSSAITTLGQLRTMAWALSLTAAPMAAAGVQHFFSHLLVRGRIFGYIAPLTQHAGDLALMLNLILPLTLALFLVSRRPAMRGLLIGLAALDVGAIIVTFSRAGFMTLVTTFLLYLWSLHRWRERKWAVLAVVLAVVVLPLLAPGYLDRLGTITNIEADQTGSARGRADDTRIALAYVLGHPLMGSGLGTSKLALTALHEASGQARYMYVHDVYVHNVYLEHAMDLGWPGLGLFLLLLVSCIKSAARVRDCCTGRPALRELSSLAEAIRIMLVAFAVSALFYPVAYHPYFYIAAALAVAASTVYETEARTMQTVSIPAKCEVRG